MISGNKWKNASADSDFYSHSKLIEEKNKIENDLKKFCKHYVEKAGHIWPEKPKPTSIEKMFKELNKEVEYRTVYLAMCKQSHQDQEDLINSLLRSQTKNQKIHSQFIGEKHSFSLFICLWGIRYYLEALESLGKHYNFASVTEESKKSILMIDKFHKEALQAKEQGIFPEYWVASVIDGI